MRVLCIGRHQFLSEHLCRYFEKLGLETTACVGVRAAADILPEMGVDAVICDYDLLATLARSHWDNSPVLADVPVLAVSLTRHPGEAHLLDVNGIAGFFYLPTLDLEEAERVLAAIRPKRDAINPPNVLPWSGTTPVAQLH